MGKVVVTPATRATLNFCREKSSAQNLDWWDNMFNNPKYRGSNFLHLWGKEGKIHRPSSHKGGKWLQAFGSDVQLCACASRAILNHAPIGEYRQQFHMGDRNYRCLCRTNTPLRDMHVLETRHHLLTNCKHVSYPDYGRWGALPGQWRPPPLSLEEFLKLLKENTKLFAFNKVQVDPG
jgi:hypothetical protein